MIFLKKHTISNCIYHCCDLCHINLSVEGHSSLAVVTGCDMSTDFFVVYIFSRIGWLFNFQELHTHKYFFKFPII